MRGDKKATSDHHDRNDDDIPIAQSGARCLPHDWLPGIGPTALVRRLPRHFELSAIFASITWVKLYRAPTVRLT